MKPFSRHLINPQGIPFYIYVWLTVYCATGFWAPGFVFFEHSEFRAFRVPGIVIETNQAIRLGVYRAPPFTFPLWAPRILADFVQDYWALKMFSEPRFLKLRADLKWSLVTHVLLLRIIAVFSMDPKIVDNFKRFLHSLLYKCVYVCVKSCHCRVEFCFNCYLHVWPARNIIGMVYPQVCADGLWSSL